MRGFYFCLTIMLVNSITCLSQDNRDYYILNLVIQKYKNESRLDSSSFVTELHFTSKPFDIKDKTQMWERYLPEINELVSKNELPKTRPITESEMKNSFVKWESEKIQFDRIVENENGDFFYFTKPVFVSDNYFVISIYSGHTGGGGGISMELYMLINDRIILKDSQLFMYFEIFHH